MLYYRLGGIWSGEMITEVTMSKYIKRGWSQKRIDKRLAKIEVIRHYMQECYYQVESKELASTMCKLYGGSRNNWLRFFRDKLFLQNRGPYKLILSKYELMFYKYCRRIKCIKMY